MNTPKERESWSMKRWLHAALCALVIFSTIPVARAFQRFIYESIGQGFFTYFVFAVILCSLAAIVYYLAFKLRIKRGSQYLWLTACAGFYLYLSGQLREHPEEAIHLLEYGLLAFFLFRALNHKIHDWTVYISAGLLVLFIGTLDEFLQWLMPVRFWSYRDVGINAIAGGILLLALYKGIRPEHTGTPVKKYSVKVLSRIIFVNLIFFSLCLSNTPGAVKRYTALFQGLSWLRHEEPMTEYGFRHADPDIGIIYSRFTLEDIRDIDTQKGTMYSSMLPGNLDAENVFQELTQTYNPSVDPFFFEFLTHLSRRENGFRSLPETPALYEKIEKSTKIYKEDMILQKYYSTILQHSGLVWPEERGKELRKVFPPMETLYISTAGNLITAFSLKTVWTVFFTLLITTGISCKIWQDRLPR